MQKDPRTPSFEGDERRGIITQHLTWVTTVRLRFKNCSCSRTLGLKRFTRRHATAGFVNIQYFLKQTLKRRISVVTLILYASRCSLLFVVYTNSNSTTEKR